MEGPPCKLPEKESYCDTRNPHCLSPYEIQQNIMQGETIFTHICSGLWRLVFPAVQTPSPRLPSKPNVLVANWSCALAWHKHKSLARSQWARWIFSHSLLMPCCQSVLMEVGCARPVCHAHVQSTHGKPSTPSLHIRLHTANISALLTLIPCRVLGHQISFRQMCIWHYTGLHLARGGCSSHRDSFCCRCNK